MGLVNAAANVTPTKIDVPLISRGKKNPHVQPWKGDLIGIAEQLNLPFLLAFSGA